MNWKNTLRDHFPEALAWPELVERCTNHLNKLDFTPENTLYGNVVCRDEINQADVKAFGDYWGHNFDLTGLAGFPSAGLTGFTAYHHHVPDDGNLLVLYGPHIGISQDGELGKIEREGIASSSSACGALVGLLAKAHKAPDYKPEYTSIDPEQYLVEQSVAPHLTAILNAKTPLKELTLKMYDAIESQLTQIIDISDFNGQIIMLGGVMINTPLAEADYFQLRHASIRNFQGRIGETYDWREELKRGR